MRDMNLGLLCRYADKCPLYKGSDKKQDMPLHILRNVFCNRGMKGWKNCIRFHKFRQEDKIKNSPDFARLR